MKCPKCGNVMQYAVIMDEKLSLKEIEEILDKIDWDNKYVKEQIIGAIYAIVNLNKVLKVEVDNG